MTRDDDFIGQLEGYLDEYEGMTPLPGEVRDAIRSELPSTRQSGLRWGQMRYLPMSNNAKLGLAAAAVVALAIIGVGVLLRPPSGAPIATVVETPSPPPSASGLPTLFMPGSRGNEPAGEFGWVGAPGSITGMHNVVLVGDGTFRQTQIVFAVNDDCFGGPIASTPTAVTVAGFDARYVEPYAAPDGRIVMFNERGSETTGAYALAIGDRTLCVYLSWDPTTTPAELAAARAVIESIRAETAGGSIRIVFTTEGGWDTG
jgi:hypothetical protein